MNDLLIEDNIEKVKFICSIKNCKKGIAYKIIIINKEKSLGDFLYLETNELKKEEEENDELNFEELKGINYNFNKRQLINIQIVKKEFKNYEYYYNSHQRLTCMASLINSGNSLYERKINEIDINSEIISIKLEKDIEIFNSEIYDMSINHSQFSIFDFFNKGSKLKFHFLFDFSKENKDNNEFLKSINIFNDILLYCYNNYHLYTAKDEVYMYGIGAKINDEENESKYFSIKSNDHSNMVKTYKNAKKCFINCLNKIKRRNDVYISPFLEELFDNINFDKKIYNVAFLCLRNLSNENDLEKVIDLIKKIKEKNLPLTVVLIYIKDENNIYKIKDNLFGEYSNLIYIEIDKNNNLENKLLYCFQNIGENISKFTDIDPRNNKETIISTNVFDCNDENYDEDVKNDNNIDDNINNELNNKNNNNMNKRRIINISENPGVSVKSNPYLKNQNSIIKESENESESTENKNMKNREIINPYANYKSKGNYFFNSNQKTDSDSYNNQSEFNYKKFE